MEGARNKEVPKDFRMKLKDRKIIQGKLTGKRMRDMTDEITRNQLKCLASGSFKETICM